MTIRKRLTILFIIIVTVPVAILCYSCFMRFEQTLETSGKHKVNGLAGLEVIASLRKQNIERFFQRVVGDMMVARESFNIRTNFPIVARGVDRQGLYTADFLTARSALDSQFKKWLEVKNELFDIALLDRNGTVVYSANPKHAALSLGKTFHNFDALFSSESRSVGDVHYSQIYENEAEGNKYEMDLAAPLAFKDDGAGPAGYVIFEVDLSVLYDMVQDMTGLGDTGETVLARKVGNDLLFLNPLRHEHDAALKKMLPLGGGRATGLQRAVRGEEGSGRFIDYRGKESIGAWRYLPFLDAGLVVKIDADEMFREVNDIRNEIILIGILVALLAALMAWVFAKSVSDPIKRLKKVTDDISIGRLDVKIDNLNRRDEIGDLARSFERVLVSLKLAMRETAGKVGGAANKDESRRSAPK